MVVEIWSDIVCPWCYIGKREFEKALNQFEHKEDVEVIWKSFELDPYSPKESTLDSYDLVAKKYGFTREKSIAMHQNVVQRASQIGLKYNMEKVKPSNSFDAHRLTHLAISHGVQNELVEHLSAAYFTEGKQISNPDSLVSVGIAAGLDANEITRMLESDSYSDDVREDENEAKTLGISGVPFFVINRKYGISGGQPSEVFLQNLNQIWAETPYIKEGEGAVCTPEEGCETAN
jgi:predicted DsbA family dithiol-disulfide isomerase